MRHYCHILIPACLMLAGACSGVYTETRLSTFTVELPETRAVDGSGRQTFAEGETIGLWDAQTGDMLAAVTLSPENISGGGKYASLKADTQGYGRIFAVYPVPEGGAMGTYGYTFDLASCPEGLAACSCDAAEERLVLKNLTSFISFSGDPGEGCASLVFRGNGGENFLTEDICIDPSTCSIVSGKGVDCLRYDCASARGRFAVIPGIRLDSGFSVQALDSGGSMLWSVSGSTAMEIAANSWIDLGDLRWKNLGTASYSDAYFGFSRDAAFLQSRIDRSLYRVEKPYLDMCSAGRSCDDFLEISVDGEGLADFRDYCTGYMNSYYGKLLTLVHPRHFSETSDRERLERNRVLKYGDDGIPAQIQLAPFYYMADIGGWDMSGMDGVVLISYPAAATRASSLTISGKNRNFAVPPFIVRQRDLDRNN